MLPIIKKFIYVTVSKIMTRRFEFFFKEIKIDG